MEELLQYKPLDWCGGERYREWPWQKKTPRVFLTQGPHHLPVDWTLDPTWLFPASPWCWRWLERSKGIQVDLASQRADTTQSACDSTASPTTQDTSHITEFSERKWEQWCPKGLVVHLERISDHGVKKILLFPTFPLCTACCNSWGYLSGWTWKETIEIEVKH